VIADDGRLADHHAHAMIDDAATADARGRVDVDARQKARTSEMSLGRNGTLARESA